MSRNVRAWAVRALGFAVMLTFPLIFGPVAAAALALFLPLAVENARVTRQQLTLCFCAAGLAAGFALTLPSPLLWIALAWCAASVLMLFTSGTEPVRRGAVWALVTAGAACAVLAMLGSLYPAGIAEGLSWACVDWLSQRENLPQLLVNAWQSGLARLDPTIAKVPAINLFGVLVMTEPVRLELLHSMRYTLQLAIGQLLPQVIVWWMGLTGLLCAAVPDMLRRKQGKAPMLPPFGQWKLPTGVHHALTGLLILGILPFLIDHPVAALMGRLSMTAFQFAYTVLGLCVMEGMMKRAGMSRMKRRIIQVLCMLVFSFVPTLIGLTDRVFRFREPRREHDDNNQGGYDE